MYKFLKILQRNIDLECLNFCELSSAAMMRGAKSVTCSRENAGSGMNNWIWTMAIVTPRGWVIVQVADVGYKETCKGMGKILHVKIHLLHDSTIILLCPRFQKACYFLSWATHLSVHLQLHLQENRTQLVNP